jgi:hypothetical protein
MALMRLNGDHNVRKHLLSALIFASFTMLLFIVALGIRSYRVGDVWTVADNFYSATELRERQWGLGSGRVVILFQSRPTRFSLAEPRAMAELSEQRPSGIHAKWNTHRPEDLLDLGWGQTRWRRMGFALQHFKSSSASSVSSTTSVAAPFWFLAMPFGIGPTLWVVAARRRRLSQQRGLCPNCYYDLRMTPQRCPECGWTALLNDAATSRLRPLYTTVFAIQLAAAIAFVFMNWPTTERSPWLKTQSSLPKNHDQNSDSPIIASSVSTSPATRASTGPAVSSTRRDAYRGYLTLESARKVAEHVDLSQTYVFLDVSSRESVLKNNIVALQVFARTGGRWRGQYIYVRPNDPIGRARFPTTLKVAEARATPDDLIVNFVDASGQTQTRSAAADSADPIRQLLILTTTRADWDRELFDQRSAASK